MALTPIAIDKLKPGDKFREMPDGNGLYLGVGTTGAKSWIVRFRFEGKPRKLTLGRYPALSLAAARRAAADALFEVSQGRDPTAAKRARKASQVRSGPAAGTVGAAIESYISKAASQRKTGDQIARYLRKELASWRERQLSGIGKADIHELLDAIVARGAPIAANRTLSHMRTFFAWACQRGLLDINPAQGIRAPAAEQARDRVLSLPELRRIMAAAQSMSYPYGHVFRLLALTGQRRSEIANMAWPEINGATLTLGRERTKNKRPHTVHFAPEALAIIEKAPRFEGVALVFTAGGRRLTSWHDEKRRLDAIITADGGPALAPWVIHDLRRSAASGMAGLGVPIHVVERILNHTSGTFGGIVSVYQKYSYADECRNALTLWAKTVTSEDE